MTRIQQLLSSAVVASLIAVAPSQAIALDKNKGKSKGKPPVKQHWNPAPPKKNFRHDNRNWNKQKVWRNLSDGTRYQSDGRYYYWNGTRYDSLAALSARRQQTKMSGATSQSRAASSPQSDC